MIIDERMSGKRNWLMFFLLLSCHVVFVVALIFLHHFHGSVHPVIQPAQQSAGCSAKPLLCDSALSVISPGEMGVPGLRGPQGFQGPQGDTGKSGLKGSETPVDVFGDVGDPGKPGTSYCWEKITLTPGGNSISSIPSEQHQTDHPSIQPPLKVVVGGGYIRCVRMKAGLHLDNRQPVCRLWAGPECDRGHAHTRSAVRNAPAGNRTHNLRD